MGAAFLLTLLTSCLGPYGSRSMYELEQIAFTHHFHCKPYTADPYLLMGCEKQGVDPKDLYVYIEGDGLAWRTTYEISDDPTPRVPVAFKIATRNQTGGRVIYLARPGQYVESPQQSKVDWTSGRFSNQIIQAYGQLINGFNAPNVHLIGYSGGATVSLLLIPRVKNIRSITTYAGVLNHRLWTTFHDISPLWNSLNPEDLSKNNFDGIEMTHYYGSEDETVPPELVAQFKHSFKEVTPKQFQEIKGFSHDSDWETIPHMNP